MRTEQVDSLEMRLAALEAAGGSGNLLKVELDISDALRSITGAPIDVVNGVANNVLLPSEIVLTATGTVGSLQGQLKLSYEGELDQQGNPIATLDIGTYDPQQPFMLKFNMHGSKYVDLNRIIGKALRLEGDNDLTGTGVWKLFITYVSIRP